MTGPTKRITRRIAIVAALSFVWATIVVRDDAWAAGAAYQVDTVEISEAGACKVESWVSWASNRDFIAAASPTCAFHVVRPVELSVQMNRTRSDDEWATAATPKVKVNLSPSGIGTWGWAISATSSYDLITRENTAFAVTVPGTLRLSDVVRVNINGGWLWDRTSDRQFLTYGVGVDWRTPDNVWTLTAEVFGQVGSADSSGLAQSSLVQPRFQTGLRWRPIDRFNIDLIYGRNITGENANWITVATIVRFPPPGK